MEHNVEELGRRCIESVGSVKARSELSGRCSRLILQRNNDNTHTVVTQTIGTYTERRTKASLVNFPVNPDRCST